MVKSLMYYKSIDVETKCLCNWQRSSWAESWEQAWSTSTSWKDEF